jgi:hypothetical protein
LWKSLLLTEYLFCHDNSGFNFTCTPFIICYHATQIVRIFHILQFLGALAKLRNATVSLVRSLCLSACPHGTFRLPLKGFLWNLIFVYFSKLCRENSRFIKSDKNKGYCAWRPMFM